MTQQLLTYQDLEMTQGTLQVPFLKSPHTLLPVLKFPNPDSFTGILKSFNSGSIISLVN